MKLKILVRIFILFTLTGSAQPVLVNNDSYAFVNSTAFDSLNNKIYFNHLNGCPTWSIPCALNYSLFSQHNLINMHDFSDNDVSVVQGSKHQVAGPGYPINRYSSGVANQTLHHQNRIYTNFGYYFNCISEDLATPGAIWSYSPSSNASYKEISAFEIKGDSVILFQKDSTSGINYYSVLMKNKLNGADIPFSSLLAANPSSSLGAIEGFIRGSVIVNDQILLGGNFTASVSGNFIARNLVCLNLNTGQLWAPPVTFTAGSIINDIKKHNGKIHIAGQFLKLNNKWRNNYAVLDQSFNITNDSCYFNGDVWQNTYLDRIAFYDKYMIAMGNYWGVAGQQFNMFFNLYSIRVVDLSTNTLMNWNLQFSGYPSFWPDQVFDVHRNKFYIKRKNYIASEFKVYCFEPVTAATRILFPGSTLSNPIPSVQICSPSDGNSCIFIAPVRYANTYNWTYSGANATLVPLGNGSTAKLITSSLSTNGILTVTGYNDCGLSSQTCTLDISIALKPEFSLPASPQSLNCDPDSTLLQASSTNTNASMVWKTIGTSTLFPQPFHAKSAGNYRMIITDNVNQCKDSGTVVLKNNKIYPNAKITSHIYPGPVTPIDTVSCYQPTVSITADSDTSGTVISWKSITGNSVYPNPVQLSSMNNLKVIVIRTNNGCVDSSLIVLVAQDDQKPNISVLQKELQLNCSIYTVTLQAAYSPTHALVSWSGAGGFSSSNPGTATNTGKYYCQGTNTLNGCSRLDSVQVTYSPKLLFNIKNDTVICKGSAVQLWANTIGTVSPVNYSWSTGSSASSIIVTPTVSTPYTVFASAAGCSGSDTVTVEIPKDLRDSVIAYRDCDESEKGTLVLYAKGGIPPYRFSLNGSAFSLANTYAGLPFGTHTFTVRDSLGCQKSATVGLSAESELPVPKFLAATDNHLSDTLVLVDISVPRPDSVHWLLPPQAVRIGGDMFNPVIVLQDTGIFLFKMKGFFGHCIIETVKSIRFGETDSLQADHYNANGIKSCILFPNPNSGEFTVNILLWKKQHLSIQVWDQQANKYLQQNFYDTDAVSFPVDLPLLPNGTFLLRVIAEFDSRTVPFIIQK